MTNLALATDPDAAHEERIKAALDAMYAASAQGDTERSAAEWCEVVRLIGERSRKKVERMERERGLAP